MDDSLMNKIKEIQANNLESVSSLQSQISSLETDNKNNVQLLFSVQKSINLQPDQVRQVDEEKPNGSQQDKRGH